MRKWAFRLFVLLTFAIGIGLVVAGVWGLWKLFKKNPFWFSVVTVGLIITLISTGFYLFSTFNLTQANNTVEIVDSRFYIDDGLLSNIHYMQYELVPTVLTEPDKVYQVKVDNGMVNWTDKIYWEELELAVGKPLLIKHKISQEEYNALGINPKYSFTINEVRSTHEFYYLMLPIAYIGLLILFLMIRKERHDIPKMDRARVRVCA